MKTAKRETSTRETQKEVEGKRERVCVCGRVLQSSSETKRGKGKGEKRNPEKIRSTQIK